MYSILYCHRMRIHFHHISEGIHAHDMNVHLECIFLQVLYTIYIQFFSDSKIDHNLQVRNSYIINAAMPWFIIISSFITTLALYGNYFSHAST